MPLYCRPNRAPNPVCRDKTLSLLSSISSRSSKFQELVNLRMVSLKDGYLDMMRWDQLKQGKILLMTVLRNRMYTHGSRIWFQVAKRMQSSSFLIWNGCLDSTVCTIKTWWRRKRQIYLFTRVPRRHTDSPLTVELSYGHVMVLWM